MISYLELIPRLKRKIYVLTQIPSYLTQHTLLVLAEHWNCEGHMDLSNKLHILCCPAILFHLLMNWKYPTNSCRDLSMFLKWHVGQQSVPWHVLPISNVICLPEMTNLKHVTYFVVVLGSLFLRNVLWTKRFYFRFFKNFQVIWLHLITGKHWLIFKLVFFYEPSEHHTASDLNRLMKRVLWLHRGWARIGPCVCHLPGIDGCCPPTPVHHTGFHQLQKWIQNGSRKWCLCKCHCHHSISITMAPLVVIEQHREEVSQRWHECDLPSTRCIIIFKVSRRPNNYS